MLAAAAAAAAAVVPVLGRLLRAHDGRPAGAIVSASGFSGRRLLHSRPVRTTLTGGYQVGKPGLPTWTTVKGSETHREKERDTHTHTHTHTHNRKGGGPHRNSLAWQNEPSALAAGRRSLEDLIGWADTSLSSPFNAHVRSRSLPFSARLLIDRLSLVDIVTTVQDCAPIPVPLFFSVSSLSFSIFFLSPHRPDRRVFLRHKGRLLGPGSTFAPARRLFSSASSIWMAGPTPIRSWPLSPSHWLLSRFYVSDHFWGGDPFRCSLRSRVTVVLIDQPVWTCTWRYFCNEFIKSWRWRFYTFGSIEHSCVINILLRLAGNQFRNALLFSHYVYEVLVQPFPGLLLEHYFQFESINQSNLCK